MKKDEMKNNKVMKMIAIGLAMSMGSLPFAHADGGDKVGGGGDSKTEGRIDDIRNDILQWLDQGGAQALNFPKSVTYENYITGMRGILAPHVVVTTAIATDQEKSDDEELNTTVAGQPKTCKGFISKKDGLPHILCNIERFSTTSESDQYRLIHHEFAGLVGVEKNVGASSDYSISNQITDYLVPVTVLRLAVKSKPISNGKIKRVCRSLMWNDDPIGRIYQGSWLDTPQGSDDSITYCSDVNRLKNGEYELTHITVQPAYHSEVRLEASNHLAHFICKYLVTGKSTQYTRSPVYSGANWEGAVTSKVGHPQPVDRGYYVEKSAELVIFAPLKVPAFETLSCKR